MWNIKALLSVLLVLLVIQLFFGLEMAQAYDDEQTVSRSPNLSIPDECGHWVEDAIGFAVPPEAIVLYVDVSFTVSHPYPSDLIVELQYDDTNLVEPLWNMDGSGSTYTRNNIYTFYGKKANALFKLRLEDCDPIGAGTLVSWTLTLCYHVPPDPPTYVWASTGSGPREVDVSWYRSYDPQCGQYWVEWNRNYQRLVGYDEIEGFDYARSCDSTSKTVNGLHCVDQYYFRVRTVSTYGANIMGKPSSPPAGALSSYCQNVVVGGSLRYVNYDDKDAGYSYYPTTLWLPSAQVTIWEWDGVTGDSFAVPPLYTGNFGEFVTTLALVNHPIYMKYQLVNQSGSLVVSDWDSQSIVVAFSDTLGPDNSFDVLKDEYHPQEQHLEFARASYSWDYLQRTRDFFQQSASYWDTPPVKVWYDYYNVYGSAVSDFDSLQQVYWMRLTSKGEYGGQYEYRKTAPFHEDAHLIHLKAWDIHHLHPPDCPDEHYPDTRSSAYCALVEGWAEFLSCIVTGDKALYIKHENQELESNHWWAGPDGRNTNGSFVEGAVASAWYDMEDDNVDCPDECSGSQYYDLWGKFANIFDIFKTYKPQNITDFMDYCQSDTGLENWEKSNLIKIFAQHHIFKPGDANSDGSVTVADIVFLVNYLFKGGPAPSPLWRGDANGDCKVTIADIVYLVSFLFKQGPKPFFNPNCWQ